MFKKKYNPKLILNVLMQNEIFRKLWTKMYVLYVRKTAAHVRRKIAKNKQTHTFFDYTFTPRT